MHHKPLGESAVLALQQLELDYKAYEVSREKERIRIIRCLDPRISALIEGGAKPNVVVVPYPLALKVHTELASWDREHRPKVEPPSNLAERIREELTYAAAVAYCKRRNHNLRPVSASIVDYDAEAALRAFREAHLRACAIGHLAPHVADLVPGTVDPVYGLQRILALCEQAVRCVRNRTHSRARRERA
jgi:hypothetical protein